jgi:putative SNF2 domain helicase|nr:MAG TPA: Chromatin remodeling complex ATPase [Caudoviricetes sp.]
MGIFSSIGDIIRGSVLLEFDDPNKKVTISGIYTRRLFRDFSMYAGTKVMDAIVLKRNSGSITFYSFYLPDIHHIANTLLTDKRFKRRLTSTRYLIDLVNVFKDLELTKNIEEIQRMEDKDYPVVDTSFLKDVFHGFGSQPFSLLPHQQQLINSSFYKSDKLGLKGYLYDSSVGSGKTLSSLSIAKLKQADKVIVICPKKAVMEPWQATISNQYKVTPTLSYSMQDAFNTEADFIVTHYESLGKLIEAVKKNIKHFQNKRVMIIADECHNMNSYKSDRSTNFRELCRLVDPIFCLWMSGTPLKALGSETMTMFSTIDPLFTPNVEKSFLKVYGISGTHAIQVMASRLQLVKSTYKGVAVDKELKVHDVKVTLPDGDYYTLDAVSARMSAYVKERSIYYEKNMDKYVSDYFTGIEMYKDTIKMNRVKLAELDYYLSLSKRLHRSYNPTSPEDREAVVYTNHFEDKVIIPNLSNAMKHVFRKAKSVYKYVTLTIVGEALGNILGRARIECNTKIVEAMRSEKQTKIIYDDETTDQLSIVDLVEGAKKKTLIFTDYVDVVKRTTAIFQEEGLTPIAIFGETTGGNAMARDVQVFKKEAKVNPLVTTFKTLGEAVPLTEANRIIFLNIPFRSITYEQAYGRAYRLGQDEDVDLFKVTLDTGDQPNISTRNDDIMRWSDEMTSILLGKKVANTTVEEAIAPTPVAQLVSFTPVSLGVMKTHDW